MEYSLQSLNAAQRIQLWAERIAECRGSGKSVRSWCRENAISEKTYYYWQKKLYQQMVSTAEQVSFAEIPREVGVGRCAEVTARISMPGGSVEIYPGADAETIRAIIEAMRSC